MKKNLKIFSGGMALDIEGQTSDFGSMMANMNGV